MLWAIYPLGYLAYALARGAVEGRYPCPFIDVTRIGLPRTLIDAAVIALAFVTAGLALVRLDRLLAARGRGR